MKFRDTGALGLLTSAAVTLGILCPASAHADDFYFFQAPSGNIACVMGSLDGAVVAQCEISDRTYSPPPKPSSCPLSWGDRVSLRQGSAPEFSCHGDTVRSPGSPVLQYGQTHSLKPITCESEQAGMTCRDSGTGHYFRLSRDGFELH